MTRLDALSQRVIECRACPRLVAWREEVAVTKRAAYADWEYWGRPVPAFGDPHARLVICGLAPGAHGSNRTGRMFTGDRSGDWLFGALHRAGYASQPTSTSQGDGLTLTDCWITAAVRCAPPDNKPTPAERDACLPFTREELGLLRDANTIVCLGAFAWTCVHRILDVRAPAFAHGATSDGGGFAILGCYHVSQQNTFTGRLTEAMLDEIFRAARELTLRPRA